MSADVGECGVTRHGRGDGACPSESAVGEVGSRDTLGGGFMGAGQREDDFGGKEGGLGKPVGGVGAGG